MHSLKQLTITRDALIHYHNHLLKETLSSREAQKELHRKKLTEVKHTLQDIEVEINKI